MYKSSTIGKECSTCHMVKEINDYYKRAASKDGYGYTCKVCCNRVQREFHKANPAKYREYNQRYTSKDVKRVRILKREQSLKKRRRAGAKPNSRTKGRVPYQDLKRLEMERERERLHQKKVREGIVTRQKRLELGPLKKWIEEKLEHMSLVELAQLVDTSTSNLQIVIDEDKPYTYDSFVDKLLTEMHEPWRYEELYPGG